MSNKLTVLVTGATGNQGGHVASKLLKNGHNVLAFTRSASSSAAKQLLSSGAKLITGDMTNPASLEAAAKNVDAIFGMTSFLESGKEAEIIQGINLVDVARKTGAHLVFSSVASANKNTGIPHFDSKWEIEKHILQSRIEYTIIAPVYFMENLLSFGLESLKNDIYSTPLSPDKKLAQICLDDIANFAVLALENRAKFIRKRIDIASDSLTGIEAAECLSKSLGRKIQYAQTPIEVIQKYNPDLATMYKWFENTGFNVDINSLHRQYPEVHWRSFEQWLKQRNLSARIHPPLSQV